jgi:hypothetical protein
MQFNPQSAQCGILHDTSGMGSTKMRSEKERRAEQHYGSLHSTPLRVRGRKPSGFHYYEVKN